MFVPSANTLGAVVSPAAKLGRRDIGIANGFLPVPGIWKDMVLSPRSVTESPL
jgi:hypothetical protein